MGILHGFLCFIGSSSAILFTSHLAARSIPFGILSIIIVMLAVLYTLCFVLFNEDKASFPTLCVLSVFRFYISTISTIDDMYSQRLYAFVYFLFNYSWHKFCCPCYT